MWAIGSNVGNKNAIVPGKSEEILTSLAAQKRRKNTLHVVAVNFYNLTFHIHVHPFRIIPIVRKTKSSAQEKSFQWFGLKRNSFLIFLFFFPFKFTLPSVANYCAKYQERKRSLPLQMCLWNEKKRKENEELLIYWVLTHSRLLIESLRQVFL